jgi:excisionase family DNA binding protein
MAFTELITVDELAERLKVPKSWVYSKTREKGPDAMPRIKTGKYIRFNYEAVLRYLENSTSSELE